VEVRFSAPVQIVPGAHPASYTMVPELYRGKSGRDVAFNTHPYLAPRSKKEWSYTSTPSLGLRGLFQGELYFNTLTIRCAFVTCRAQR
jgi:hypothetical protein